MDCSVKEGQLGPGGCRGVGRGTDLTNKDSESSVSRDQDRWEDGV